MRSTYINPNYIKKKTHNDLEKNNNKLSTAVNKYEMKITLTQYIKVNCVDNIYDNINLLLSELTNELLKGVKNGNKR